MAFAAQDPGQNSDIVAEINITPLTDIFLVLLIIFMITSSAIVESGGKVNLPAAAKTQTVTRGTTVTLTPAREIYVNQMKVTEADFETVLRNALSANTDRTVILRGDREVVLGEVVKILSLAKKAGAAEIAIAAEAEKSEKSERGRRRR